MTITEPVVSLQIASHDTKIGCIQLLWAGAKEYQFSLLLCADPLIKSYVF